MSDSGQGKAIFVTGAASGMGRETARLFAERGWFVGGYDVDPAGLETLAKELGPGNSVTGRLDVTDRRAFERAVREFGEATGGRMDVLFNNAGIGATGWFEDIPYERMLQVIQVNFVGVVNGIYTALPLLKATPNSLCFTTSSSAGTYGMPRLAIYSATKHAVKGLTEALSIEFSRHGVRAADVLPGLIDTPILDTTTNFSADVPEGQDPRDRAPKEGPFRLMPARAVAECVWEAYGSDRLHWYVPEEIGELDRAKAASPETVREQIQSFILNTLQQEEPKDG